MILALKKQHRDYLIVLSGQSTSKFLMFIIFLLLPALIGVKEYGIFSYALSICFIVSQPFIEYGLDPIVTKYVSRGNDTIIKDGFSLRIKTSLIGFVLLIIFSLLLRSQFDITILLFFYLFFFSLSNLALSYFRGKQVFVYESILLPLFRILIIVFILLLSKVLLINKSYTGAVPFSLSAVIMFIITFVVLLKVFRQNDSVNKHAVHDNRISLFSEGSFIFLSSLLWMLYFRLDSVMLGYLIGEREVGIYSLAYRLYEGTIFLPASIMAVVFPKMSSHKSTEMLHDFKKIFILLLLISLFAFLLLFIVGELIIRYFYYDEFYDSIEVLKILSFSVLVVFPAHLTTQFLIARDKNRLFLLTTSLGVVSNLILNYLFIPIMMSRGAAIATIITEAIVLLISLFISIWIIKRE